jgi:uncharacterized membrane protein (UPF0127 family)
MSRGSRRARWLAAALVLALATTMAGVEAQEGPCKRHREVFAAMPVKVLTVEAAGKKVALRVKAAESAEQQSTGFQCATPQEIERNLILFDFGREIRSQFHMQNVPAALDIAFIKSDGRIFSILQMEPSPTALYGPMGEFRYALEARKGFFQSQGIAQGEARLVTPGR